MTIGSICKRHVAVAPKGEGIVDAAKRMRLLHVGAVVIVDQREGKQVPRGILTDRDIVLSIVASDPEHLPFLSVTDAMSDDLVTAFEDTVLAEMPTYAGGLGILAGDTLRSADASTSTGDRRARSGGAPAGARNSRA